MNQNQAKTVVLVLWLIWWTLMALLGFAVRDRVLAETIHEYCERVNPSYDPSWVGDGRFDSFVCKLGDGRPDPSSTHEDRNSQEPAPQPEPTPPPEQPQPPMMCSGHCND